jgi:hypothetical protein
MAKAFALAVGDDPPYKNALPLIDDIKKVLSVRSVVVAVWSGSARLWTLRHSAVHGKWAEAPADSVVPSTGMVCASERDGTFKGTSGELWYRSEYSASMLPDGFIYFRLTWSNPFLGTNSASISPFARLLQPPQAEELVGPLYEPYSVNDMTGHKNITSGFRATARFTLP